MSIKIDYFDVLSPEPFFYEDIGNFKSPTLREIKKLGINKYYNYIYTLQLDKEELIELVGLKDIYDKTINKEDVKYLDVIFTTNMGEMFSHILSFFICEKIKCNTDLRRFDLENSKFIDRDNYNLVRSIILQLNNREVEDLSENLSEKEREFEEIFKEGRKKSVSNINKNTTLPNIISALFPKHSDIWDWTICQVYDVFQREDFWYSLDFYKENHAFNGGNFDLNEWYKIIRNNK